MNYASLDRKMLSSIHEIIPEMLYMSDVFSAENLSILE